MSKTKILVVEDDPDAARDIIASMKRLGNIVSAVVDTGEKAIKRAERDTPDLVLMDICLSGGINGIDAAEKITSQFDIPVIYLSGASDRMTIGRAKKANASGLFVKPFREEELGATIEMVVHKQRHEKSEPVIWDSLTGVYSRAFLEEILNRDISICKRYNRPLSFMMIYIDSLLHINDKYGQQTGEHAIGYAMKVIRSRIRTSDCLARFKENTFCCILTETAFDSALICAEKVRFSISQHGFSTKGGTAKLTCSIGVTGLGKFSNSTYSLFLSAEKALERAKKGGGNQVKKSQT
ncbi:MAG: diguanylate cyclase [Nitrospiria bacterium]